MANEIYRTTHAGLAGLVSPRAATRLLDQALRGAGLDPDRLEAGDARRLLRGRLRRDLEAILPRFGLRRELARLDQRVMRLARTATPPPRDAAPAATPPREASAEAAAAPSRASAAAPAGPTPLRPPTPARQPAPHRGDVVRAVAERHGVRGVVHLQDGRVRDARGRDVDPQRVATLARAVDARLSRHGAVRSWHVHTSAGHVLACTGNDQVLLVHGRERLNLGAIHATALALEEEP